MNEVVSGLKKVGTTLTVGGVQRVMPQVAVAQEKKPEAAVPWKILIIGLRENQAHMKAELPADTIYASRGELGAALQREKGSIAVAVVLPPSTRVVEICKQITGLDPRTKVMVATSSRSLADECKKKKYAVIREQQVPEMAKALLRTFK